MRCFNFQTSCLDEDSESNQWCIRLQALGQKSPLLKHFTSNVQILSRGHCDQQTRPSLRTWTRNQKCILSVPYHKYYLIWMQHQISRFHLNKGGLIWDTYTKSHSSYGRSNSFCLIKGTMKLQSNLTREGGTLEFLLADLNATGRNLSYWPNPVQNGGIFQIRDLYVGVGDCRPKKITLRIWYYIPSSGLEPCVTSFTSWAKRDCLLGTGMRWQKHLALIVILSSNSVPSIVTTVGVLLDRWYVRNLEILLETLLWYKVQMRGVLCPSEDSKLESECRQL